MHRMMILSIRICKYCDLHYQQTAGILVTLGEKRLECAVVSAAPKQLIAIDQLEQRHRLLAQRMDDVMVVDDKQSPTDERPTSLLQRSFASDRRKVRSRVEPRKQSSRSSQR